MTNRPGKLISKNEKNSPRRQNLHRDLVLNLRYILLKYTLVQILFIGLYNLHSMVQIVMVDF